MSDAGDHDEGEDNHQVACNGDQADRGSEQSKEDQVPSGVWTDGVEVEGKGGLGGVGVVGGKVHEEAEVGEAVALEERVVVVKQGLLRRVLHGILEDALKS